MVIAVESGRRESEVDVEFDPAQSAGSRDGLSAHVVGDGALGYGRRSTMCFPKPVSSGAGTTACATSSTALARRSRPRPRSCFRSDVRADRAEGG